MIARNENPNSIRKKLLNYISSEKSFNIPRRSIAIKRSIELAKPEK